MIGKIAEYAEKQGLQTVAINFFEFDRECFASLSTFLRSFCRRITIKLKFKNCLDDYWDSGLGSKGDCIEYFEDYLLPQISGALVLELDEVDTLFDVNGGQIWAIDFFSMLRAWVEKGRTNLQWKKLRLVLVHAKDFDQETLQQQQSPFNVGTEIRLGEFSEMQVVELAELHGIKNNVAISLMSFVGGHPQLIRMGLYSIARGEVSLDILISEGATEAGFYGNYLRQVRTRIEKDSELLLAFKRVLASINAITIDQSSRSVLQSLGVVKMHRNEVKIACELYRQYFGGFWS